ncbi:mannitol-1-phosphate 5-dehydrogenase [Flagelloscypha sp. PMI_526]|nr:mannitol-1-phosphate 5-dehydrogenase [Flagelloscypha sp. PMI_526]
MSNAPTATLPNLGKRALHFGAGNIGRGFIGPLLSESGYTVTFADINERIINLLNAAHHYSVEILSENQTTQIVRRVEGIISTSPDVVDLLARTGEGSVDIITTSVGPFVLPRLAGAIAAGFEKRMLANGGHLNVIACENMVGATDKLAESVLAKLADKPDVLEWTNKNVGWANCAVDRIVPPFETPYGASELDVGVEPFFEWTVDQTKLKGEVSVKGMKLVENLEAYVERKLYTLNCGHASLAYLGTLRGYRMIDDTLGDEEIRDIVQNALLESGRALTKKHGFDPAEHDEYIELIMQRFSNPVLKDDCEARRPSASSEAQPS